MNETLPAAENPNDAPRPLSLAYSIPSPAKRRSKVRAAAWACAWLFFAALAVAGLMHPDIPGVLLAMFVALPLAGVVLGTLARPRAGGAVTLSAIELCLVLGVAFLLPTLCRSSEQANLIKCASNLRQIGWALMSYADRHDGRFPARLDALISGDESDLPANVLVCPSSNDSSATGPTQRDLAREVRDRPEHLSYVYVGGDLTRASATPDHVVAYDKPHNHKGGGIEILYGDGHVEFQPRKEAERIAAELDAGHNPPRRASANP